MVADTIPPFHQDDSVGQTKNNQGFLLRPGKLNPSHGWTKPYKKQWKLPFNINDMGRNDIISSCLDPRDPKDINQSVCVGKMAFAVFVLINSELESLLGECSVNTSHHLPFS